MIKYLIGLLTYTPSIFLLHKIGLISVPKLSLPPDSCVLTISTHNSQPHYHIGMTIVDLTEFSIGYFLLPRYASSTFVIRII